MDMCFATNQGGYDRADALDMALTIAVIAEDAVAWKCSSSQEQTTQQRYMKTLISSQRQDQTVSSRVVQATCCASTSNRRFTNLQNSPHGKTEAAKECSFGLGAKPSKKFKDAVFVRHQDRARDKHELVFRKQRCTSVAIAGISSTSCLGEAKTSSPAICIKATDPRSVLVKTVRRSSP